MPGRGPEDILIGTNKFMAPQYPLWDFQWPPHSTAVIFHGPTLHVRFHKSGLERLGTDVVEGHLKQKQDSLHAILWNIMQEIPIMLSILTNFL